MNPCPHSTQHSVVAALMRSDLVVQGWRFPTVLLAESDDRVLFDLEVSNIWKNVFLLQC
jgi:hypothetical protein